MTTGDPLTPKSEHEKSTKIYQLKNERIESIIDTLVSITLSEVARYEKDSKAVEVETTPMIIGLTQDQLEDYRNDPFWKPFRLILFALFWLAWIGMFVAAIVIVVFSPQCPEKQQLRWWQSKISYQAWIPGFKDSDGDGLGDLKGMTNQLDELRKIGIQTVWPTPVLQTDQFGYLPVNYVDIDPKLGTIEEFKKLIAQVHEKSMYLIMDFPFTTTSVQHEWFKKAQKGDAKYQNYYIWTDQSVNAQFWRADSNRRFYLHYENRDHWPVLNWDNEQVRKEIQNAAKFWIDLGVDGFCVGFAEYLARNSNGIHSNWEKSMLRLADFVDFTKMHANGSESASKNDILIFTSLKAESEHKRNLVDKTGLQYVMNHELAQLIKFCQPKSENRMRNGTIAKCLHRSLRTILQQHEQSGLHPMWENGSPYIRRLATRLGNDREAAELFTFIQLLLPGSNNFYYGDEIGMLDAKEVKVGQRPQRAAMAWNGNKNAGFSDADTIKVPLPDKYEEINFEMQQDQLPSQLKTFTKLNKLRRRDETLMKGDFTLGKLNEYSFAFSRINRVANSTMGMVYIGLVNFGDTDKRISIDGLYPESADLSAARVVVATSNVLKYKSRQGVDLNQKKFTTIGPKQGILFRF